MADRFECFYGPSGEGKSTAALAVAARIWKERKKKTRVYIGDGSGSTYHDSGLVEEGIIQLFDFTGMKNPFSITDKVCSGWFPNDKGVLVAPTPAQLAEIGGWIYEGASVMGNYLLGLNEGGLAYRSARGEKIGQDSPISIIDGDVKVGGNPPSHYNVGQRAMGTNFEKSKALPGWVIWTAHERSVEDKISGEKLIGPEIIGQAMTASVSRIFQNTLHFCTVMSKKKIKDPHSDKMIDVITPEYRVYTRDHFDADGNGFIKYKAVTRCPKPDMIPDFLAGEKPGDNIIMFYQLLHDAKKAYLAEVKGAA